MLAEIERGQLVQPLFTVALRIVQQADQLYWYKWRCISVCIRCAYICLHRCASVALTAAYIGVYSLRLQLLTSVCNRCAVCIRCAYSCLQIL